MSDSTEKPSHESWVVSHMGKSSEETARRLLTTPQPKPPADAPRLLLRGVKARCVGSGASNFWIIDHPAAEPVLNGDYPMIAISPTAYFVRAPEFNDLPYAIQRRDLTTANHEIRGDLTHFEAQMRQVYGRSREG